MAEDYELVRIAPHRQGRTRACYSLDGHYIFTTGADGAIRRFQLGSTDEPLALDPLHDDVVTGIACSNDKLVTCSEDATVSIFDVLGQDSEKLCRTTLPIREIAFDAYGEKLAIASDETRVKVVDVKDMSKVFEISHPKAKSIRHVSFHPSGNLLAITDSAGVIRMYSMSSVPPVVLEELNGLVQPVAELDSDISTRVAWHPDGKSFAVPTVERDIAVYDRSEWRKQVAFRSTSNGHTGAITHIAWSPNGAFLASTAQDKTVIVWDTAKQTVVRKLQQQNCPLQLAWHPAKNFLSWTTSEGEVITCDGIVPAAAGEPFGKRHASPLANGAAGDARAAAAAVNGNGASRVQELARSRARADDGEDLEDAGADWIEDDDGAGYVPNLELRRKRVNGEQARSPSAKRRRRHANGDDEDDAEALDAFEPALHPPLRPGSTPWRGGRRYLTLNSVGWVWTVDQEDHNTVTVEFHDTSKHRQYHFTDHAMYAHACLDDEGALFAARARSSEGVQALAQVHYRPHEHWARNADWTVSLPAGEDVVAIALCRDACVVATTKGYLRSFVRGGGIVSSIVHARQNQLVCLIGHASTFIAFSNGPVAGDGSTKLVFTVYECLANEPMRPTRVEGHVPLPGNGSLRSAFFGDDGQPYIYTNAGLLSALVDWHPQTVATAKAGAPASSWVPVLDTASLTRRAGRDENYWPVGVSESHRFGCVILKGAERHPYFPRPITSEFDLVVPALPLTEADRPFEDGTSDMTKLAETRAGIETTLVTNSVRALLSNAQLAQLDSGADESGDGDDGDVDAARQCERDAVAKLEEVEDQLDALQRDADRCVLQLLNMACRAEDDARALALCKAKLAPRKKLLEAAVKVAAHHHRVGLAERIGRL